MKISTLEEYGIRCLSQLARADGKVTIARIAEAEGLSEENTAKVMSRLRMLGFAQSIRGKDGGYVLARPADGISVAEVIEKLAGSLFELERCEGPSEASPGCIHKGDCSLRPMWTKLEEIVHAFLAEISIADLVQEETAATDRVLNVLHKLSSAHENPPAPPAREAGATPS